MQSGEGNETVVYPADLNAAAERVELVHPPFRRRIKYSYSPLELIIL